MTGKIHNLKTSHQSFHDIKYKGQNFLVRFEDHKFQTGDTLNICETEGECETGETITAHVGYILHGGQSGIEAGYVVMGLI